MEETHVVTCFLREGADVLLLLRSDEVGSYAGRWGGVAGHVDEGAAALDSVGGPDEAAASEQGARGHADPDAAARAEIREETGVDPDAVTLAARGDPFPVEDADLGREWVVHPYLFDCGTRLVETNQESTDFEWVRPPEILRRGTVPALWESYAAVAPTLDSVRTDASHGSAYLSLRALEVLRDRAALAVERGEGGWEGLVSLARELVDARPSMVALRTRVDRAVHEASGEETAAALEDAANRGLDRALDADDRAAGVAADRVAGATVCTLSRSGTVLDALREGDPEAVVIPESRPGREGVGVAEDLAAAGLDVTLTSDAAASGLVEGGDCVLVGADAVLPDATVINKVGTSPLALAAARADVPVYAVCAGAKVSPDEGVPLEDDDPSDLYDGDADLAVENPLFERTPGDLVTAVLTEDGPLDADGVGARADEHRALTDWR